MSELQHNQSLVLHKAQMCIRDRSMTERDGCPSFVFFEGPPSANGMPGIHHVMARTIKDILDVYKRQT